MENSRYKLNEEFQEEEIWGFLDQTKDSDSWTACSNCNSSFDTIPTSNTLLILESDKNLRESRTTTTTKTMSAPVNIPAAADWSSKKPCSWLDEESNNYNNDNNNNVMIPPHELIAKNQTSSFSVFEGVGRTLKGRDLSRVRYAVLTKTGFLESKSHRYPL